MDEAVGKLLEIVRGLEPGERTSTAKLALKAGIDIDELDAFDLHFELNDACLAESILLDDMESFGAAEGLPYFLDFAVRPVVNPCNGVISLDEVTGLIYSEGGFHQGRRAIALLRDDAGRFVRRTSLSVARQSLIPPRLMLSRRYEAVLSRALERCAVRSWEREYANHEVLDGEQWELRLALSDGSSIHVAGSNAYPEGFETLRDALERVGLPMFR